MAKKVVKVFDAPVFVLNKDSGAVEYHPGERFERNKDLIIVGNKVVYSKKALKDLPKLLKLKAEASYQKVLRNVEKSTNSKMVLVSKEVAQEVKESIEVSNEAKEETPKGDKEEGSVATPTHENNTKITK